GAEGHKAPLGIPGGIPRPGICLAANSFVVYAGPLARPLVLRVNFPGGKFRVCGWWVLVYVISPGGKIVILVFAGPLARPFFGVGDVGMRSAGALRLMGCVYDVASCLLCWLGVAGLVARW
ncbi:hypothetical protein, partial [Streptomyces sp. NPDC003015]